MAETDTQRKKNSCPSQRRTWIHVSAVEASGTKVSLPARRQATNVYTSLLHVSDEQRTTIDKLYDTHEVFDTIFEPIEEDQLKAAALLASHGLDSDTRGGIEGRYVTRWSEGGRVLYQCRCGYDHTSAGTKIRRSAWDYTGCLAHAEITYATHTQHILRIRGYLNHNDECDKAIPNRMPSRAPQKAALNNQKVAQVFGELGQLAPKLADMAEQLKDARLPMSEYENAVRFRGQLGVLCHELDRMISSRDSDQSTSPSNNAHPTTSHPRKSAKRARKDILGASPEKQQTRKDL